MSNTIQHLALLKYMGIKLSKFLESGLSIDDLNYNLDYPIYKTELYKDAIGILHKSLVNSGGFYYIFGNVGTGKTVLAKILGIKFLQLNKWVYFTTAYQLNNRFFEYLNDGNLGFFIESMEKFDVLILDDLEKINFDNRFIGSQFLGLLDSRYTARKNKFTIVTSNLAIDAQFRPSGEFLGPILDRFRDGLIIPLGERTIRGLENEN